MSFSAALSYSKRLTAAAPVLALVIGGYWYTSTQLIVDKLNGGKARIRPSDVLGKELVDLQTGRPFGTGWRRRRRRRSGWLGYSLARPAKTSKTI